MAHDLLSIAYGGGVTSVEDWATVLLKQLVLNPSSPKGHKELWAVYLAHTVSVPGQLRKTIERLWNAEPANVIKEPAKKAQLQWLLEEMKQGGKVDDS